MSKRSYSDKEKGAVLAVLDSNAGNLKKTSRETGIPLSTLEGWAKNRSGVSDDVPHIRNEKKEELADIFERLTRKGLAFLEQNISSGKFGEVSLGVCQWTDKMQLLSGKPTGINENRNTNVAAEAKRLIELAKAEGIPDLSEAEALEFMQPKGERPS